MLRRRTFSNSRDCILGYLVQTWWTKLITTCTLDGRDTFCGMGVFSAVNPGLTVTLESIPRRQATAEEINSAGRIRIVYRNSNDSILSMMYYDLLLLYLQKRKEVKKQTRIDKRKSIEDKAEQAEEAAKKGKSRLVYKMKDSKGNVLTSEEQTNERWAERFENVLNPLRPPQTSHIQGHLYST
ncbi:hypothetical protein QYM36_010997 [Artemia franciscana]|uniref:Uncharacterized protein n=1 Tax=Artemia franciscana TaxID=6661 RepID=A0AA88HHM6_ARTSF|nr:hypothetical protein QYM36_010997 [Artemia franciscana]